MLSYTLKASDWESKKSVIAEYFFKLPGEFSENALPAPYLRSSLFSTKGGKLPPEGAPSFPKLERSLRKPNTDKCLKQMMGTWGEGTDQEKSKELPLRPWVRLETTHYQAKKVKDFWAVFEWERLTLKCWHFWDTVMDRGGKIAYLGFGTLSPKSEYGITLAGHKALSISLQEKCICTLICMFCKVRKMVLAENMSCATRYVSLLN